MEPSTFLLPKKSLTGHFHMIEMCKREHAKAEGKWQLIGKYHKQWWFQKAWQKNEVELLEEYRLLVVQMERLEDTIEQSREAVGKHYWAVEQLKESNTPFVGIDFKKHELVQQSFFEQ